MARKTSNRKAKNFNQFRFIPFRFSAQEKKDFNKWLEGGDGVTIPKCHEMLQDDIKISLSWSPDNDCFTAAGTGKEDSLNENRCLTVKSDTWERALFALVYVHTVVFKSGVWEDSDTEELV